MAALPEPQRSWLENIDGLSDDFNPPTTASRETLICILDRLEEDIGWLWWAQDVLVTVVTKIPVYPTEPVSKFSQTSAGAALVPASRYPSAEPALPR